MKAVVLLNEGAGTLAGLDVGDAQRQIARRFANAGAQADVRFVEPRYLRPIAQEAARGSDFDVIFAGGGDGTINTIANVVADSPKTFGVLPLGTHNHFAKDLKIPLDLDQAIAALVNGQVIDLPVAEVNGHVFLNFSAIGLHPEVVMDREAQREEKGRGKWPAMAVAMTRKLINKPAVHKLTLSARGHTIARRTPSVIVCNNAHQMEVFGVANVSYSDRGVLNVYLARATKWYGVLWLIIRAAFRQLESASKFEAVVLPEFSIDTRNRHARVSIDGEVTDLRTPLNYRVRKSGLKVIRPAPRGEEETRGPGDKGTRG